jgi:hypothetical protein
VSAPVPVQVTAVSEWGEPQHGLVVETPAAVAGVIHRTDAGWTTAVYVRFLWRSRVVCASHDSAHAAVTAILNSHPGRRLGITAWSDVHWTDAASRAARDAWGLVAS